MLIGFQSGFTFLFFPCVFSFGIWPEFQVPSGFGIHFQFRFALNLEFGFRFEFHGKLRGGSKQERKTTLNMETKIGMENGMEDS